MLAGNYFHLNEAGGVVCLQVSLYRRCLGVHPTSVMHGPLRTNNLSSSPLIVSDCLHPCRSDCGEFRRSTGGTEAGTAGILEASTGQVSFPVRDSVGKVQGAGAGCRSVEQLRCIAMESRKSLFVFPLLSNRQVLPFPSWTA